jgi:ATP-binding cassette subfamily F protein uup
VQTLAVLEEYLEDFTGCVIVVSHDRYFLDRTVDRIFALEPGGNLRQYPGNYSVYLDFKKAEEETYSQTTNSKEKREPQPIEKSQKQSGKCFAAQAVIKEKREFEMLEGKIAQLEVEKSRGRESALQCCSWSRYPVRKLYEQVEALKQAIDTATERWLELAEIES